jgi:hypothetical protein
VVRRPQGSTRQPLLLRRRPAIQGASILDRCFSWGLNRLHQRILINYGESV